MDELTIGELRFVNESTNVWNMLTISIMSTMENVPESVKTHLDELGQQYREEFLAYYTKEKKNAAAEQILGDFDQSWEKKCPEFYDFRKLFSDCSQEDLQKAEEAIQSAQDYVGVAP